MTDNFGKTFARMANHVLPTYYAEAETDVYPYAVYSREKTEQRTKDGVFKICSDLTVTVYSKSFDRAASAASALRNGLDNMGEAFRAVFRSSTDECVDGIWSIELRYNVYQIF